jgi:pimeloyl-ACP methyl ester carboxylesterase
MPHSPLKVPGRAPAVPGFNSEVATVGAIRIHYWIGGEQSGSPILLWHGFLGTGYMWRHVMTALAEAGFAVLVPDMRGYGDSDKPPGTKGYDGRALAEEFRALVHEIGFGAGKSLTLVAHDMGAPPALLWAADHPEEISSLFYLEVPVMLSEVLRKIFEYTPEAMKTGSMWWWLLPLAPGAPERLIVGNERAFLTWFYGFASADANSIEPAAIDEYLRTFSGTEGVLGALGIYRAAFTTIDQTAPLTRNEVRVPVIALGGEKAQGARIAEMVALVAETVEGGSVPDCGHFIPEEQPDEIVRRVRLRVSRTFRSKADDKEQ